ncbi:unnamed protein product [Owenia fusiformis]|uniref:Uncharacterized protein n=1 Tax=Owenia fusiformis TaxID=6347 RepID=A0A8S4Q7A0_OWEFU|nr:unnamed protein product [Owenia fusiformis]
MDRSPAYRDVFNRTDDDCRITMEECYQKLLNNQSNTCSLKSTSYSIWFCGHDVPKNECNVQTAKRHIESFYGFIGFLEYYEASLDLLARIYPKLFHDVRKILATLKIHNKTIGIHKVRPSNPKVIDYIKNVILKTDYDIYRFTLHRFYGIAKLHGVRINHY